MITTARDLVATITRAYADTLDQVGDLVTGAARHAFTLAVAHPVGAGAVALALVSLCLVAGRVQRPAPAARPGR